MGYVGGQAVLEGVMMRGNKYIATSVRKPDGLITTKLDDIDRHDNKLKNIPIIRGIINLIDSVIMGMKVMDYSARMQETEEDRKLSEQSKTRKTLDRLSGGHGEAVSQIITLALSFALAIIIFTVIPTILSSFLRRLGTGRITLNITEAMLKLVMFILYIYFVSKVPDVNRVFKYHGAEHKTIAAYEGGLPLTVENVRNSSRYHARCGTNFLFLVLIVSIIVFTFIPTFDIKLRILIKILLIPLVAGITFEIIMWLGKNQGLLSSLVSTPGKLLQRLTTSEPEDSMIEVAIEALMYSEGLRYTIKDARSYGLRNLKHLQTAAMDRDILLSHVLGCTREAIILNPGRLLSREEYYEYTELINDRKNYKPVAYITGTKEFMGYDFKVTEDTLIPRPDTETLVTLAEDIIKENNLNKVHLLDMCTGSGAIGISLTKRNPNIKTLLVDISEKALEAAMDNAVRLSVNDRCTTVLSDLFENVRILDNFDVIVSNPPYIRSREMKTLMKDVREFEPKIALDGGNDGLIFYDRISDKARRYLKNGGYLIFEIGHDQAEEVCDILKGYGYKDIKATRDLEGRDRVISAKYIHDL